MADEPAPPDGLTEFIFDQPGTLVVDASYGKAAFPVPTQTLVFTSEGDFLRFMQETFNALVTTDPSTGAVGMELNVVTKGIPYISDASGTALVAVDSPVITFLGGPDGYFVVDDEIRCTDPLRCVLECLPTSPSTGTSSSNQVSALSDSGLHMVQPTAQAFAIASKIEWEPIWLPIASGIVYSLRAAAITEQIAGQRPYDLYWCGPPTETTLPSGVPARHPKPCSTAIREPTTLVLTSKKSTIDYDNYCWRAETFPNTNIEHNVPRLIHEYLTTQTGSTNTNTGIKSFHKGTQHVTTVSADRCRGSGCFKFDPCTGNKL